MMKLADLVVELSVALAREGPTPFAVCQSIVEDWAADECLPEVLTRDEFFSAFGSTPPTVH